LTVTPVGELLPKMLSVSVDHNMTFSSTVISYYLYWQYIWHISNFCMVAGFEYILGPMKKSHEIYRNILWSTLPSVLGTWIGEYLCSLFSF
jgi:hypothetical protein